VVIENDDRVRMLWRRLVERESGANQPDEEVLPWAGSFRDLARNHYAGGDISQNIGDMVCSSEGSIAYTARKFLLHRSPADGALKTFPPHFVFEDEKHVIADDLQSTAWELASELTQAMMPPGAATSEICVSVQRLKYDESLDDVIRKNIVIDDAIGTWAQRGRRVDAMVTRASGLLDHRYVRDAFGLAGLNGLMRRLLDRLNDGQARRDPVRKALPGFEVIGRPHTDSRLFSAMCSRRDTVRTEIYDGAEWHELPAAPDTLCVFPGNGMIQEFGIEPTMHRILMRDGDAATFGDSGNVTLLFGITPAAKFEGVFEAFPASSA